MQTRRFLQATSVSLAAAAVALVAAFGTARQVRAAALRQSHQLPSPEVWFEPAAPSSPALVAAGRKFFVHNCAHCHGLDAHGDEGPDLHGLQVSDRYIMRTVSRGIPHEMPAFARKLHPDDVPALTAYLRSLDAGG